MAARAYWQGQIRLALVSIPVEIYTATKSSAKIRFNQIHEPSGKRISYEKVVPGIGPVDRDDIIKGYEVSKGEYVLLDEEEIDAVKLESKRTLELVQFVDAHEIDPLYFEKPYYVAPKDELAEEAFIVLREALRKAKKVALGQLAMRGSEKLVAIKPCGKGLLLETLRYAEEVREGQEARGPCPLYGTLNGCMRGSTCLFLHDRNNLNKKAGCSWCTTACVNCGSWNCNGGTYGVGFCKARVIGGT